MALPAPRPTWPAAALGAAAGLWQVCLLREVLLLSGGLELGLGLGLAAWLGAAALGAALAGRLVPALRARACLLVLAPAGMASLVLARTAPLWLGLPLGEVPPLATSLLASSLILLPAALTAGAGYPLILAALDRARPGRGATGQLGRTFALEALGAGLAAAGAGWLLTAWLTPLGLTAFGGACLAAAGAALAPGRGRALGWALAAFLAVGVVAAPPLDRALLAAQWPGARLAAMAESAYARHLVLARPGQRDLYSGGLWALSYPDRLTRERAALLPLLAHPRPRRALYLGPDAGYYAAAAARRAPQCTFTAIELDPVGRDLALGLDPAPRPPNLTLVTADPRRYLASHPGAFDLIAVSPGAPVSLAAGRLYSAEALAALSRALAPGGAATLALPGSGPLLGRLQAAQLASILAGARRAFPVVILAQGPELRLFLARAPGVLLGGLEGWLARLDERAWPDVVGVRPDLLQEALDPFRRQALAASLAALGPVAAHRDTRPTAVILAPPLWAGGLEAMAGWALDLGGAGRAWPLAGGLLLASLWVVWCGWGRRARAGLAGGVLAAGLGGMGVSLLAMLAWQVRWGAVYLGLAFLVGGFMLGLGLGSWALDAGRLVRESRPEAALSGALAALALAALGVAGLGSLDPVRGGWPLALGLWGLTALAGAGTGAAFAAAGRARLAAGGDPARVGGGLYGLDLAGGMLGALLPALLVPTLGLAASGGLLIIVALGAAGGVLAGKRGAA